MGWVIYLVQPISSNGKMIIKYLDIDEFSPAAWIEAEVVSFVQYKRPK